MLNCFPIIQFEYVTLNIKEVENLLPEDTANFWFFSSAVLKKNRKNHQIALI